MLLIGQADNLPFSFSFGFFPLYRCQDREVCFSGTTIYKEQFQVLLEISKNKLV